MPRCSRYCAYRRLTLCFPLPVSSKDLNGAVVAHGKIALEKGDQGTLRLTTTDSEGAFIFVLLPHRKYSLIPTREGFVGIISTGKRRLRQRGRNKKTQPSPHRTAALTDSSSKFRAVHALIVEITLAILLILSCCTLVMPKMTSLLEEWRKWQTSAHN